MTTWAPNNGLTDIYGDYAGRCPGVTPDELMKWRAESRAKFQNRAVSEVLADISRARDALRKAPEVILQAIYGDPGRGFAGGLTRGGGLAP